MDLLCHLLLLSYHNQLVSKSYIACLLNIFRICPLISSSTVTTWFKSQCLSASFLTSTLISLQPTLLKAGRVLFSACKTLPKSCLSSMWNPSKDPNCLRMMYKIFTWSTRSVYPRLVSLPSLQVSIHNPPSIITSIATPVSCFVLFSHFPLCGLSYHGTSCVWNQFDLSAFK